MRSEIRKLKLWSLFAVAALGGACLGSPKGARAEDIAPRPARCTGVTAQPLNLDGAQAYTYNTASGRALRLHVFRAPGAAGRQTTVIFYFGGGWRSGDIDAFIQAHLRANTAA